VTGGTLPAALGAAILAAAWDQVSRSIPELLGPRCPIVQAPMAGGGDTPALVAADGEAGAPAGLGTLAA
jgi:NAD(P)H-dependent flavin oxidoreductase YrpB (nitropropane dioxygenase family)